MEGDQNKPDHNAGTLHFNPLPPHGGRHIIRNRRIGHTHFNPLPPHGGRLRLTPGIYPRASNFNPLPPHGGRLYQWIYTSPVLPFQSTPSAWRETIININRRPVRRISIHSLRMEGDSIPILYTSFLSNFNPLPPHGGRHPEEKPTPCNNDYFNPLPPHGGRQPCYRRTSYAQKISIHSLRMEGDIGHTQIDTHSRYFNPLPPHGGRQPPALTYKTLRQKFQSTPSAWRETSLLYLSRFHVVDFNPLPPHGGRRDLSILKLCYRILFQSTPSAWRETSATT